MEDRDDIPTVLPDTKYEVTKRSIEILITPQYFLLNSTLMNRIFKMLNL